MTIEARAPFGPLDESGELRYIQELEVSVIDAAIIWEEMLSCGTGTPFFEAQDNLSEAVNRLLGARLSLSQEETDEHNYTIG